MGADAELLHKIEIARKKINQLGKTKPLTDSVMVKLSKELDSLLNDYHRMCQKAETKK